MSKVWSLDSLGIYGMIGICIDHFICPRFSIIQSITFSPSPPKKSSKTNKSLFSHKTTLLCFFHHISHLSTLALLTRTACGFQLKQPFIPPPGPRDPCWTVAPTKCRPNGWRRRSRRRLGRRCRYGRRRGGRRRRIPGVGGGGKKSGENDGEERLLELKIFAFVLEIIIFGCCSGGLQILMVNCWFGYVWGYP